MDILCYAPFPVEEDSASSTKKKTLSIDEYKKRRSMSIETPVKFQGNEEKNVYSEIAYDTELEESAPESVTWKLLPAKNKRPTIRGKKSVYVQQDIPNRATTMILTEKLPLEKISLNAFRDLPLPAYRSTVITTVQAPKMKSPEIEIDNDIFADLAEMLNFKNETSRSPEEYATFANEYEPSPLYNEMLMADTQSTQLTVDDSQVRDLREDNRRYYSQWRESIMPVERVSHERNTGTKRRNEDCVSMARDDKKRRKRNSGSGSAHRHQRESISNEEPIENLYEMMLRAKHEHEKQEQRLSRSSPIRVSSNKPNYRNSRVTYRTRTSRIDEPRRRSVLRSERSSRFNIGGSRPVRYNWNKRKMAPYARESSERHRKPYSTR